MTADHAFPEACPAVEGWAEVVIPGHPGKPWSDLWPQPPQN